jgi:peptide/nickel transport system substrate-binding protein
LKPYEELTFKGKLRLLLASREGSLRLVIVGIGVLFALTWAACADEPSPIVEEQPPLTNTAVPSPHPSPTSEPVKELWICIGHEPESLNLYDDQSYTAVSIRHAIYENLYTTLDYSYQPQGLVKLPSLADGDAFITQVEVHAGDKIVAVNGDVVLLAAGVTLLDAEGNEVVFNGTPLLMNQLTADFTMKPMRWSDGTAVTAQDSVYSFELAASSPFASDTYRVERTVAYIETDTLSMRWAGLPGYLPKDYAIHVWAPLPAPQQSGELTDSSANSDQLLSNGPFVITEWILGDSVTLVKNPHYYRSNEALPRIDRIKFKFLPETNSIMSQVMSGGCDIGAENLIDASQSPFILEAEKHALLVAHYQTGTVWEHLDFGINPVAEYAETRPDWFEDVRVRQAIAMCIDRQRMVDDIMFGQSTIAHSYIAATHPLYPDDLQQWPYDVAAAKQLLEQAGYRDTDGDGIRENPSDGVPFAITLGTTTGSYMRQALTEIVQENLQACGIAVSLYYQPASEWFADGPDGVLFGRKFDLAEYAWSNDLVPSCHYWMTENIPGAVADGFGGWDNDNNTGWSSPAFDDACRRAQAALPGTAMYTAAHQEALRIFTEELPIIPLFYRLEVAISRPEVTNYKLNTTQPSDLWNLYELDIAPAANDE